MLVTNAKAFTGRDEDDFQYAFQIVDGSIAWVGAAGDAPDDPDVLDLRGATVLPGLLDVHTHPALLSQLIGVTSVLPPSVTSIEGLIATMRTHPGLGKGPGVWIRGFGFDDAKYPEGRWPDRHDLDRVSTTQPVFVQRCDAHSAVVNTFLLRLAGISSATPDPIGAQIGRDAGGEPDGRLVEPGSWLPVLDLMPTDDDQSRIAKLAELGDHFADHGIVGVGDMAATFIAEPLASFRVAAQRSWLPRIGLYPFWADIKDDPGELTDADRSGPVFLAGVKLLMDGAYSNATAWCHDPYPGSTDRFGIRTTTPEDLVAAGEWARRNRVQLACHAMGDAAIDAVLDAFEDEEGWLGDVPSVRIEHSTLFTPERIQRVANARMRFALISHTIFFFAEIDAYLNNMSPEQYANSYPIRSFYERIPHTALASDNPATAWADADNVFTSVQAAVTRRAWNGVDLGQSQAITVPQAVLLYTARAASCMRMDGLGSLEVGKEGTFVVLDRDLFTVPAAEIGQTRVDQTWVAGVRRYPRRPPVHPPPHDRRSHGRAPTTAGGRSERDRLPPRPQHTQIQMIAIGGAIGVGLFLGIARPLTAAGPALIISYLFVATLVYLLMRACGELVLADPRDGSFVTWGVKYVHRAWGAYTGWIYVSIASSPPRPR